jgi:hypothetical protein
LDSAIKAEALPSSELTRLKGLTRPLWPIRYKPLPDELLSSWLVRLAHGHGLKVQTFCNIIFGNRLQVWNRDVDRLAPQWLLSALVTHTGTSERDAWFTTLRVYEGHLCRTVKASGHVQWLQSLLMYHRTREGYGQQYCPACLASDGIPYFRKSWRVALKTMCLQHECLLLDRCGQCAAPISFHRIDMGHSGLNVEPSMRHCHACNFDLATAHQESPEFHNSPASLAWMMEQVQSIDALSEGAPSSVDLCELDVLRNLVGLMLSRTPTNRLNEYVAEQIGVAAIEWPGNKRIAFESLPRSQRHQLLLQGAWLMLSPAERVTTAWQAKAIRYNHLVKDFEQMPDWYRTSVIAKLARRPYTHRR